VFLRSREKFSISSELFPDLCRESNRQNLKIIRQLLFVCAFLVGFCSNKNPPSDPIKIKKNPKLAPNKLFATSPDEICFGNRGSITDITPNKARSRFGFFVREPVCKVSRFYKGLFSNAFNPNKVFRPLGIFNG
jgi:hypothetical protein